MSASEPAATGSAPLLAEQWRAASLARGWMHPDDWDGAPVVAMTLTLLRGGEVETVAGDLGRDRAARGVGLLEGLGDLAVLYSVAVNATPPFGITRAFVEHWTEVATATLLSSGVTDALTGLRTGTYAAERLREIYAEERETGVRASGAWKLVVIEGAPAHGWRRILRDSAVARVMRDVLCAGQTNALLPSGRFVSIARASTVDEHVIRVRHRLRDIEDAADVTVDVVPLPEFVDDASATLASL